MHMQDGTLIQHNGNWIASLILNSGQLAHEQLNSRLTDEEAAHINSLPLTERLERLDKLIIGRTRV